MLGALGAALVGGVALAGGGAATPALGVVGAEYTREVRPLMRQYCLGCHSTARRAGELDLQRFVGLREVRREPPVWSHVAEMLENGEMPPKGAPQPGARQRAALIGWVRRFLRAEALANAGDPGPVVLRRLNNAQYTYTIRDLTGLELDPAREFPTDSAAGEGFTNTGASLVMSPALLTKYFDAGKEIAQHVELLPDGFRFSPDTTRSDWTNRALERIRALYARYADAGGASTVNLQGIVFNTNDGGRLPIERYLTALLAERDALRRGARTPAEVARPRGLSGKYLGLLHAALEGREPSLLLDPLRARWRMATPADVPALTAQIAGWQKVLWRLTTVGHIGRAGGPTAWQEPVVPLTTRREVRLKLPPGAGRPVSFTLLVRDAGDGGAGDTVVWQQPRLVYPGRPELPLRDLREFAGELSARRERFFASTEKALEAVDEASRAAGVLDAGALAQRHGLSADALAAWMDYLGVGGAPAAGLAHFGTRQTAVSNYAFINGWGSPQLPSLVTNSSNQSVRIPGVVKPHGVCVHPAPTLAACVGWQSPIRGSVRLKGRVTHAHPECGNGVTWALEVRRGSVRQRLGADTAQGNSAATFETARGIPVQPGDLVSLVIGPRDGNHSCDLTDLELSVIAAEDGREWSLTRDVADDVLAGNPHADRFGNPAVWHFYSEPVAGGGSGPTLPANSLLARWLATDSEAARKPLAAAVHRLLISGPAPDLDAAHPDRVLHRQLTSLAGPLFARVWRELAARPRGMPAAGRAAAPEVGLDPALFGTRPNHPATDPTSLVVRAPSTLEVRIPAELAEGAEFVTTAAPHPEAAAAGSVQVQAPAGVPPHPETAGLLPGEPVLVGENGAARRRFEEAFAAFRALFPAVLAYTRIVPVDEVVTLTLFHREDEALRRLMLSDTEARELDRLWAELRWVSQGPLRLVNAYEQITEFATQDRPDLVVAFRPLRKPIQDGAAAFERELVVAEPRQLERLLEFAGRAYRRPLSAAETSGVRGIYRRLRTEGLSHEEAFRLTLARVLVSPSFLYRLEAAPAGPAPAPVSAWELAGRLSYFLWSSTPDDQLRAEAAAGRLHRPEGVRAQVRRMLADPRMRRLAAEFACQWLQIYDFDTLDEKSERHFPEFVALRGDMYEEAIRFCTELFQKDGSLLRLFDADYTFVNERLARFYGIPGVTGDAWRRVTGMRARGRGGILGLSATLAKQSGASRTSPILRGNWVSEVLLGEKLPKPPKDVPRLPEEETATEGLTVRQLVARHTRDPKCAGCHQKIDPFGFALEGFDAIGRRRTADLANRPIDTATRTPDGQSIAGLSGLRDYLLRNRRATILRQFCRKLLGYALGRAVQLSDEPLLTEMEQELAKKDYRFSVAVQSIVNSRQFRQIRAPQSGR